MPSRRFEFTGDWQTFNVPAGVKRIDVVVAGGGSGDTPGGRVTGSLKVDGKDALFIMVGRRGYQTTTRTGGSATFGGGGAGGNGGQGRRGGASGGGASAIYLANNAGGLQWETDRGSVRAVAGGAGGSSGDGGQGGRGGADLGQQGERGNGGTGATGLPTGGTQNQGGKGGSSSAGAGYKGGNGQNTKVGRGGAGGGGTPNNYIGGGGGGGGYYPGGGGSAGAAGIAPAVGGAGGSNYIGGLYGAQSYRGTGNVDHGFVTLTWEQPGGNEPPIVAKEITINGQPIADGLATKATSEVTVAGKPDDPDAGQGVRMLIHMSKQSNFATHTVWKGDYDPQTKRDKVEITGLEQDTRYYLRIYTQDINKKLSQNYRSTNFWTNRKPQPPEVISPPENAQFSELVNVTFQWRHRDPDPSDPQARFQLRYRPAGTPLVPAGDWITTEVQESTAHTWTIGAGAFKGGLNYEWQVRTRDAGGLWSEWSGTTSYYLDAATMPPVPIFPTKSEAIVAGVDNVFTWKFRNPNNGIIQERAEVRWRPAAGHVQEWTTIDHQGPNPRVTVPAFTFEPSFFYAWQVRTYSQQGTESDWSETAYLWTTRTPGSGAGIDVIPSGRPREPLGQGVNRAFIYDRGGQVLRGEVTPLVDIMWNRKRDDISGCVLHVNSWDADSRKFLASIRCWMHELVIFRDGERVWEGPVTRTASTRNGMEIEAKDPLAYVYRRIMRQGYNDAYRMMNGEQLGQRTVVERAQQIILNALAYDDPNLIPYLTPIHFPDDARQTRIVKDYSRTAWEEVDDLAATAGLDYTTSGRRILLWDTHRPIGRLPAMMDGDFSDPPVVAEYGMSYANYFAVTNNNGIWGAVQRGISEDGDPGPTGYVEQLASNYGEGETGSATSEVLTRAARNAAEKSLRAQAGRNIGGRYPSPLVVRIPDNSTLNPELNLGVNQLIPGVWIPLHCTESVREVSQWQKLDSMQVTQDANGEKIAVVMSPAPNAGADPDAEQAIIDEAGGV